MQTLEKLPQILPKIKKTMKNTYQILRGQERGQDERSEKGYLGKLPQSHKINPFSHKLVLPNMIWKAARISADPNTSPRAVNSGVA